MRTQSIFYRAFSTIFSSQRQCIKVRCAAVPRLTRLLFVDLLIPLLPLALQEQIVKELDKFDTLIHSISEELLAEIALRLAAEAAWIRRLLLGSPCR